MLGSVGRLHRQKGYSDLLRVASKILPVIPNLQVVIIGEGPERQRLQTIADELGIADRVSMPGLLQSEISELLPAFDVFMMTSLYEGVPATLAESMRSGLPSVVTDAGGIREMIDNGVTGIMAKLGDFESLCEAVVRLAQDPQLRDSMGARARELFDQNPHLFDDGRSVPKIVFRALATAIRAPPLKYLVRVHALSLRNPRHTRSRQ